MSIKAVAASYIQEDEDLAYPHAAEYGDHYSIVTYPDGSMDVLWEGKVIASDLPYCEDPYPIIDSDAWERYESVGWFAQRGVEGHTPRVPFV